MPDDGAGGSHFLVDAEGPWRQKHRHLGTSRLNWRLERKTDIALWPQHHFRDYEFFRQTALYEGDYKPEVKLQVGSAAIVEGVAGDKLSIGYSSIGYRTDGVRAAPLAVFSGAQCYDASPESVLAGKYPLARYLYIYLNKKPGEPLDALRAEFIKHILSKDGQTQIEKSGCYPITEEIREAEFERLGLATAMK